MFIVHVFVCISPPWNTRQFICNDSKRIEEIQHRDDFQQYSEFLSNQILKLYRLPFSFQRRLWIGRKTEQHHPFPPGAAPLCHRLPESLNVNVLSDLGKTNNNNRNLVLSS